MAVEAMEEHRMKNLLSLGAATCLMECLAQLVV
jgi:hypothetical protein